MLVNRVGDLGLVLSICSIFLSFKTLDYSIIFSLSSFSTENSFSFLFFNSADRLSVITFFIFFGALGKSAQIGLHIWLPDAMEGPTPVSALIHAATLVTAGLFLIIRCSVLFEECPTILSIVTIMGSLTAFFAASVGLVQNDLKKVIAYSTCSQLGFMMFACGLSHYSIALFHLANHALFKALLFLSAGCVIHGLLDEQDLRKMGGLLQILPISYTMILIGSLALVGFPFLTGFYSKDVILEVAFAKYSNAGHFAYWLGTFAAFFTAFYSMRLSFLTFLSEPNGFKPVILGAHDSPIRMALPLFILAFPSIFIGYCSRDLFIGLGTGFWNNAIFIFPTNLNIIDAEFAPQFFKLLPVCLSTFGASLALVLYTFSSKDLYSLKTSKIGRKLYNFLNKKWFFDKFYNEFINQKFLDFGYHVSYKAIDRGFIEMVGPYGLSKTVLSKSRVLSNLQTGSVYDYALWMFVGLLSMIILIEFWGLITFLIDPSLILMFFITILFCVKSR